MKARIEFDIEAPTQEVARERLRHFAEMLFDEPGGDMVEAKLHEFVSVEGIEDFGYDTSDPKHPEFHSTHADIWDAREGK